MASARELLEQADALMQRNRSRSGVDVPVLTDVVAATADELSAVDVPVLTDVVEAGTAGPATGEYVAPARMPAPAESEPAAATQAAVQAVVAPRPAETAAIMRSVEAIPVELPMEGDMSDWLVMDTIDPSTHSITGVAPDTLAVVPPVTLKAAGFDLGPPPSGTQAAAPMPAPPMPPAPAVAAEEEAARAARAAAEDERWRALAEQVTMQVLQRVDLFTDAGLKTQLAEHLQPIVERASADLVSAITEHVGRLLRTYIAEGIEREIAQWRREH
ncbi:MAG: hypothetical protein ACHP7M_02695 [Burkholderiales bacterium]|jgi:hypothetical protein